MTHQNELPSINGTRPRCVTLCLLLVSFSPLITALSPLFALPTAAGARLPQEPLPTLEMGKPVERKLAGGETHIFRVALTAGQYLHVVADQRGIDITLRIIGTDGQRLIEMDSPNDTQGPESAAVIAEKTGSYRIEIHSSAKDVPAGRYEVATQAIRLPTAQDRKWIAAQSAYAEGQRLRMQGAAESRLNSVEKYQEAILNWRAAGDRIMEAHALFCIGRAWQRSGQSQKALDSFGQALQLQRSAGERREETLTLYTIGVIYNDLGEPRKSLECFSQALSQQQAMADVNAEARTLNNMGVAWHILGESRKALEHHNHALSVWQKVNNRPQEAVTFHYIGRVYETLGEFQKALESYFQALARHRALRNRDGEADELNSIGYVNGLSGEWQKALDYYNRALALWRVTGDHYSEAVTLSNIGVAHASLDEMQQALDRYQQALRLHREVGNRRGEAVTLEKISDLLASSDPGKALESCEQSLQLRRKTEDRQGEASALSGIGLLHLSLGNPQKAMEYFSPALTLSLAIGDRRGEARARYGIARAERDRGNPGEARRQIEAALSLVEAVRADAGSQQLRASYLASVQRYYELCIDTLMRLHEARPAEGFDALALEASERARARSLLELLAESRADIRRGVDAALLERERDLAQQLNAGAARLAGRNTPEQLAALRKEIGELEDEFQQLQANIRRRSPHYAAITQPAPLSLKEIRQQVLGDHVLLLEYSLGEERSWLWAVTNNSVTAYELPKREQIEKTARRVYELLTARSLRRGGETLGQWREQIARADAQLPQAAGQLSQMILGPAAPQLGNNQLLIVADGALQYVPFAMLPEPKDEGGRISERMKAEGGRRKPESEPPSDSPLILHPSSLTPHPLVVGHEITTLPSASTLGIIRKEMAGRRPAPKMLAVFADPVFSRDDQRNKAGAIRAAGKPGTQAAAVAGSRIIEHEESSSLAKLSAGGLKVPRLPFTRQEAERILAIAPGADNFKAIDFKAARAAALSAELGQYRYLHFATHGFLDSERPGFSALVLSLIDEQGRSQDGFLRANEIYNLNLPAELVVLSACQTGLGKEVRGEGLVGLTRGFMYAGAARVVVSLWNVNDKATSELMTMFYQKMLREGERPAAALRSAQVEMWKQRQWQAPYYWAAFVLQGEWK
ncbi:MAG TPA: CHAT domain-containing protein [Blastocatellia bacterium]|nr:CHAT domain-containing protein [Blastocatellia bacterium]